MPSCKCLAKAGSPPCAPLWNPQLLTWATWDWSSFSLPEVRGEVPFTPLFWSLAHSRAPGY